MDSPLAPDMKNAADVTMVTNRTDYLNELVNQLAPAKSTIFDSVDQVLLPQKPFS